MTTLTDPVAKRIATLFRMLGSNFDGEILGAVAAMKRLFAAEGLSFHDIATVIESCDGSIEQKKYSDADAKVIYERGMAKGRAEQQNGDLEFFDSNGQPRWFDMATFCMSNVGRLKTPWEREFANDIPTKVLGREPSLKQAQAILRIFVKLGGRCAPDIQARYFQR